MKLNKRLKLEIHRYAPEMNTLVVGGTERPVSGVVTIKDARIELGWTPPRRGIVAHVTKTYPEPFTDLSVNWRGYVASRADGMAQVREYLALRVHKEPATLVNGRTLPVPEVRITFTLRG